MKRSFYEMLEVPRQATKEQIDEAFARLTAKLDATTNVRGSAETRNQLNMVREGYRILSDPEKRAVYDAKLYATEAGIDLVFFPKDTKAVKKLGINTVIFAALAGVFTYVIYQKLMPDTKSAPVEQAQAVKPKVTAPALTAPVPEMPKADVAKAEAVNAEAARLEGAKPGMPAKVAEPAANPPDAKSGGKSDQK